jgi:hypothetical protein
MSRCDRSVAAPAASGGMVALNTFDGNVPPVGSSAEAKSVNESGEVVGWSDGLHLQTNCRLPSRGRHPEDSTTTWAGLLR